MGGYIRPGDPGAPGTDISAPGDGCIRPEAHMSAPRGGPRPRGPNRTPERGCIRQQALGRAVNPANYPHAVFSGSCGRPLTST